jgi:hypothetical protein
MMATEIAPNAACLQLEKAPLVGIGSNLHRASNAIQHEHVNEQMANAIM